MDENKYVQTQMKNGKFYSKNSICIVYNDNEFEKLTTFKFSIKNNLVIGLIDYSTFEFGGLYEENVYCDEA